MHSLKTLGALVAGVILLAAVYGAAFGDADNPARIEIDDGAGVRHIVSGDRGEFSLNEDDLKIKAAWRGKYELSDDGDDIESLDHKLEITREEDGATERAVFERDGDGVERSFFRDGEEVEDEDEAARGARALLEAFLGASGVKAEERVRILLRRGGPEAVIEEISGVYGDHARQRYAAELTDQTDLSADQLEALLAALKAIESDHDMRLALGAILENEKITAEEAPMILEAAERIESDYDLRRLIETVAETPMGDDAIRLAVGMMERIDSDHDFRRAAEALLDQGSITPDTAAILIAVAADHIDSDHDLRLLLSETVSYLEGGGAAAKAWVEALDAIDSDHDLRFALTEAADEDDLPDDVALMLINAAAGIDSDNDRRLTLEQYAERAKAAPALLEAYESAARGISSRSDRERALDAAGLGD
jgi:hypothetical protein